MSRLIDADAAKAKKVYSAARHEYVIPVAEIDWLPTIDPVKWIPVGERLPEKGKCVLCKWGHDKLWHGGIVIGYFTGTSWYFPEISMSYWTDVTHWMPLPEPPKMDGDAHE